MIWMFRSKYRIEWTTKQGYRTAISAAESYNSTQWRRY